jgi:hypothetical protein
MIRDEGKRSPVELQETDRVNDLLLYLYPSGSRPAQETCDR